MPRRPKDEPHDTVPDPITGMSERATLYKELRRSMGPVLFDRFLMEQLALNLGHTLPPDIELQGDTRRKKQGHDKGGRKRKPKDGSE